MTLRTVNLLLLVVFATSCSQVQLTRSTIAQLADPTEHPASQTLMEDLVFGPGDFSESNSSGMTFLPQGLTPDSTTTEGAYTSQPFQAPLPFNAVVPQWRVDLPEGAELHLEMRTGKKASEMGDWIHINRSMDWTLPEDEDVVGEMLTVPAEDTTHEFVEYRLEMSSSTDENQPVLRELRLTFIDSTTGQTVEEMILQQQEIDQELGIHQSAAADDEYPKPFVISRDVWCTNPACDYTSGISYHPVSHLILHHTVSSTGAGGDSAATVRAIWSFHTSGRGWRDIGYNYLVDTEGVIYEGHLGGDDVVGIHAAGANTGSMALSMIGTYSINLPPDPMFESAVNLFAWKADQKNIDVFDASDTLPGIEWGLPHLMGHRDVYGTTECPGGAAHALIPILRDQVAARTGFESPHIYIDEQSGSFQKSDANWYDGPYQCGYNAHSWYTYSTTDPDFAANWGEWRPDVPENGLYRVEVYAPYCNTGRAETAGAHYTVQHADGASSITVNQDDRIGLWTAIGDFRLNAGNENVIHLEDITTTDNWRSVWFDAIRLRPLEALPSATTELPDDGSWLTERNVTFNWQITNSDTVEATVLQVATDDQFENRIINKIWSTPVLSATHNFDQDYANLHWRVVVTSESNNEYPSAVSQFGLDSEPPVSAVTEIQWFEQMGYYKIFWEGKDVLNGVDKYNIDYRPSGDGENEWKRWVGNTSETAAVFVAPDTEAIYEFRSQATDEVGNIETLRSTADISTNEAVRLDYSSLIPFLGQPGPVK